MANLPIPANFATSYNGFSFDPEFTATTRIHVKPVESADGRTVSYNEYAIALRTHVVGQPTDATVFAARRLLTKNGGRFQYAGRGVGALNINVNAAKDVNFGPKTRMLSIQPKGGTNYSILDWEISFCVPECSDASYQFAPMELSYSVEFQIRANGRQNRSTNGTLRIPNNRLGPGSSLVLDNPDAYRDTIPPPIPPGFKREWGPFTVDAARTRLTFSWVDKEFDRNILPPGIVACRAPQTLKTIGNQGAVAALGWTTTISASYTLAAGYDFRTAMNAYAALINQKLGINRGAAGGAGIPLRVGAIIPLAFEMSDPDMYGDESKCDFASSYNVMNVSINQIIGQTGLWKPTGQDWKSWALSLNNSALNARGYSRLEFSANDDEIVDLCNSPQGHGLIGIRREEAIGAQQQAIAFASLISLPPPDPRMSWLSYLNTIRVETDTGTVIQQTLSTRKPVDIDPSGPEVVELRNDPNARLPGQAGDSPSQSPTITASDGYDRLMGAIEAKLSGSSPPPISAARRMAGRIVVFMIGSATRAGFAIPVPVLKSAGDVQPILANRPDKGEGFVTGIVQNQGVPVVGACWKLRYVLPSMPDGGIEPPPDPTRNTG